MPETINKSIVLFDGYCNLCTGSVVFILKRERGDTFLFASLQSDFAVKLLQELKAGNDVPDSIILIDGKQIFYGTTAALRIVRKLRGLWSILTVFSIIPKFLREPVYEMIARNRYSWFGKRSSCYNPGKDVSHKFLDVESYDDL